MLRGSSILVTGGAGFIGSNLVHVLSRDNDVIVLDNMSLGRKENLNGAKYTMIKGDVRSREVLALDSPPDYIFHLAAIPGVPQSFRDPVGTTEISVMGTMNVIDAALRWGSNLVFASTCAVYGNNEDIPIEETAPPSPLSPYASAKLMCENVIYNLRENNGLKGCALRFFNVYGPRQDPTSPYSAVIPRFIERCMAGKPPIIYGDGGQTRDFVYVDDLVRALILAADALPDRPVNIGTGVQTSIQAIAELIMEHTGYSGDILYKDPRPGEVYKSVASIELAEKLLNWRPKISMEAGIQMTIEWYKGHIQ